MSDAARLASVAYASKPVGLELKHFKLQPPEVNSIKAEIPKAIQESSYSAALSYAEALRGLKVSSSSWAIVKLYYSCFYSIRALILIESIVPFHCNKYMLFDCNSNSFQKGGASSHHWNWQNLRKMLGGQGWFLSQDSEDAYERLRSFREDANYRLAFTDPSLHSCFVSGGLDWPKRLKYYKEDAAFMYTYLADHLAIAYPTRLIIEIELKFGALGFKLGAERLKHLQDVWSFKERCPLNIP